MDISFSGGDFDLAATQSINRSVLLAGVLCIPVLYALLKDDRNSAEVEKEKKHWITIPLNLTVGM